jgi:GT2 family glycosyltransferase
MAFPNLVERALYLIKRDEFDCVGGVYFGYYEIDKPKWIPQNFGSKLIYSPMLTECPYNVPCGGIVLYRKRMLENLNGFSTNLGMSGNVKDLGEETELQYRASQLNYKIGFDPDLKIHHLIKSEYTKLSWFLLRPYLEGKTSIKIDSNESKSNLFLKFFKSLFGLLFRRLPHNVYQYLTKKKYYWQNLIYDCLLPNMLFLGRLIGSFKNNK